MLYAMRARHSGAVIVADRLTLKFNNTELPPGRDNPGANKGDNRYGKYRLFTRPRPI